MKKRIIFTLMLALSVPATEALAQTSVVAHADMPFYIDRTIIREHNYPATVSFLGSGMDGYFLYADASLSATYLPLNTKHYVNDFVIDNDTVWFCGKDINGLGFIGFFDINDFFFGSNNYYIINNSLLTTNSKVEDLTKLVSYTDNSTIRHVVAIGTTGLGQYCVVNMTFDASSASWKYETGEVPATSPETMVAIQTTDFNVFTGGMYLLDPTNPGLSFRAYDKNDVFTDPYNIYDYANEFVDATSQYSFCLDQMALIQLTCNQIGVAAFYKKYNNINLEGTYIGRYAVGKPKNLISHFYSILAPHSYNTGGWKLHGFSKNNISTYTFNLLQEYEIPLTGNLQSVVYELSTNIIDNVIPFEYVTTSDYFFQSIDGYNPAPNYLMNGHSAEMPSTLVYNMGVQGDNNCLSINDLIPEQIDMTEIPHYAPLSVESEKINFNAFVSPKITEQIIIDCSAKSNK